MAEKPSIPKGTRDFSPLEMSRRNFIFDQIKEVFRTCGYQAIETPAMENLSTLMGKYGEEGDKLLFKVLNSGDFKGKLSEEAWDLPPGKLAPLLSEKGLRYDLTVPFARYVVQHRNDISFPFKRYQIQPVWRADRPQRGRYREFYQCDADVVGSDSLLNEYELIQIIADVFRRLNLKTVVKLNNRKILAGIAETVGAGTQMTDITVAMDKLDKIGLDKVMEELEEKGLSAASREALKPVLEMQGGSEEKLAFLEAFLGSSPQGKLGLEEVRTVMELTGQDTPGCRLEFDLTLARGLNYYTGSIIEVKSAEVEIGSICGGGRYDNLTGIFGLEGVSGVGISFGADRIYDVLLQLDRFPDQELTGTRVLFANFGEKEVLGVLATAKQLREKGVAVEVYPDAAKIKKQLAYANARSIPYVVMAGAEELARGVYTLKDMAAGGQETLTPDAMLKFLCPVD
ncbi:MAG: histidine--tRNA ligase [Bacteroidales bacterium]